MTDAQWTGHIRRDPDVPEGIRGELTDSLGYHLIIKGTRVQGGYALTGVAGPPALENEIPYVDDAPAPEPEVNAPEAPSMTLQRLAWGHFNSFEKADLWMKSKLPLLNGKTPLEVCQTPEGMAICQRVLK